MARSYEYNSEDSYKTNPATGEAESRDMKNVDDKGYTGKTLEETRDEEDKQWSTENQSPIAGKMSGTMEELERMQGSEVTISEVRKCIKDSIDCYQTCTETITRCLTMGGKHAELEHVNLLVDCAKMCNTNADFMIRNSPYYSQTCGMTADICDECADSCDRFDEDFMKDCANMCKRCAESCREMAR